MTNLSYIKKRHFLTVFLLGYTFLANLLLSECASSRLTIYDVTKTDTDESILEKINKVLDTQLENLPREAKDFHFLLDCANEVSVKEMALNLRKQVEKEYTDHTGPFTLFKIAVKDITPPCKQQLFNVLRDFDVIFAFSDNNEDQTNFIPSKQNIEADFLIILDSREESDKAKLQESRNEVENSFFDMSKIQVIRQGFETGDIAVILVIVVIIILGGIAGLIVLKRRKNKKAQKKQLKVDKQKFIPRLQMSAQAPFNGQKEITGETFNRKGSKKNKHLDVPRMLSPSHRTTHALKLEDNHQSSIINDNIFTNLDNSPRSQDDESDGQSVKNTPKDIGFNIEFSMIEQDSKIKSGRDNGDE